MDFIARGGHAKRRRHVFHAAQGLGSGEFRLKGQEAQAVRCSLPGLHGQGIAYFFPEDLHAAADAESPAVLLRVAPDKGVEPALPQFRKIESRVSGAREDDKIGPAPFRRAAHGAQVHVGLHGERRHVRVVGGMPENDHGHIQGVRLCGRGVERAVPGKTVFLREIQGSDIRDDAQHGRSGGKGKIFVCRGEQGGIPAEAVHEKSGEEPALFRSKGEPCAEKRGVEPAAVDIAREQNLCAGLAGHGHVHDVILFEVDFPGRSGAFEHHDPVLRGKRGVGSGHALPETGLKGAKILCLHEARGAAEDNDLGASVRTRLEQDGVHAAVRIDARGLGLQDLGPAHFPAVRRHAGIEGHVLGFEGRGVKAVLAQDAAEGGREDGFARVGAGALQHEGRAFFPKDCRRR